MPRINPALLALDRQLSTLHEQRAKLAASVVSVEVAIEAVHEARAEAARAVAKRSRAKITTPAKAAVQEEPATAST